MGHGVRVSVVALVAVPLLLVIVPPAWPSGELDELLSGFSQEQQPEEDAELGDLLSGFGGRQMSGEETGESGTALPSWLELQGSLGLRTAVNVDHDAPEQGQPDYRGLAMFRGLGELVADVTFGGWMARVGATAFYDAASRLNDQRDLYTEAYLDLYEDEVELGEAYLQGSLADNLDIRVGRQIVVWGKSDNLRVTDVLNPLDNRWPGMTDIRYLRLPVTMSKVDWFAGQWRSSLIVVHEPRFSKIPVYNGEFYGGSQAAPALSEPVWSWDSQQPALSVNGIFSGWDISFYAAQVYPATGFTEQGEGGVPYRTYEKALMGGAAVNVALGNWLIKGEGACWDGLRYTNSTEEKRRLDLLAGLEYSGFTETSIVLELVYRRIGDYEPALAASPDGQDEETTQYALRFVRDFRHDTLHFTALISSYGFFAEDGGFERLQLDYDLNDQVTLTGGLMLYESGDQPGLGGVGDNDKIFVEVKYNF